MRDMRYSWGVIILALGAGLNFLDAYFSGNLPGISPDASDQNNKLSLVNRFQRSAGEPGMRLGTMMALLGSGILLTSWLIGRKR